jgi:hypothetical protein
MKMQLCGSSDSVGASLFWSRAVSQILWEHSFLMTSENVLSLLQTPRWVDILDYVENKIAQWPVHCFLWEY